MSHTPGPWKLQAGRSFETSSGTFHLSYGLSKTGRPLFSNPCELDSNARLIAAAPEMLAIIESFVALWPVIPNRTEPKATPEVLKVWRSAVEAIRKAKGE